MRSSLPVFEAAWSSTDVEADMEERFSEEEMDKEPISPGRLDPNFIKDLEDTDLDLGDRKTERMNLDDNDSVDKAPEQTDTEMTSTGVSEDIEMIKGANALVGPAPTFEDQVRPFECLRKNGGFDAGGHRRERNRA